MQLSIITKISILFSFIFCTLSFSYIPNNYEEATKRKSSKTIIDKIEQNLLSGWTITQIDDNTNRFSAEMKSLGFTYGLILANKQFPLVLNTKNGKVKKYPQLNIIVSSLEKQEEMKSFVRQKATSNTFQHCFIVSRQYLLTVIWTEQTLQYIDNNGQKQYADFGQSSKQLKARKRLIKQLNWYFDMY